MCIAMWEQLLTPQTRRPRGGGLTPAERKLSKHVACVLIDRRHLLQHMQYSQKTYCIAYVLMSVCLSTNKHSACLKARPLLEHTWTACCILNTEAKRVATWKGVSRLGPGDLKGAGVVGMQVLFKGA